MREALFLPAVFDFLNFKQRAKVRKGTAVGHRKLTCILHGWEFCEGEQKSKKFLQKKVAGLCKVCLIRKK